MLRGPPTSQRRPLPRVPTASFMFRLSAPIRRVPPPMAAARAKAKPPCLLPAPPQPSSVLPSSLARKPSLPIEDRKSVVEGKGVSVSCELGGRRNIKKKKSQKKH